MATVFPQRLFATSPASDARPANAAFLKALLLSLGGAFAGFICVSLAVAPGYAPEYSWLASTLTGAICAQTLGRFLRV